MGNDVHVHLDCHWKHAFLLLVDFEKLEDVVVKQGDGGVEIGGFFPKQQYKDGGIIDKCLPSEIVEALFKVFIRPQGFPQPQHLVFDADPFWSWKAS